VARETLLDLLRAHCPADAHEAEMTARVVAFVADHEDCLERTLAIGHVTASAFVVDLDRTHALLHHHAKLDRWLQLGGHVDGEAEVLRAALREATEESGLDEVRPVASAIFDVDVHLIPARGDEPAHHHHDVRFLLEADRAAPLRITSESKALAWVPLGRIPELTDEESVLRMVRKVIADV
jgi:8-oxo-dGTP pyrophosphatase MutT (NUDIX family)